MWLSSPGKGHTTAKGEFIEKSSGPLQRTLVEWKKDTELSEDRGQGSKITRAAQGTNQCVGFVLSYTNRDHQGER